MNLAVALLVGVVFGVGLTLSGMTDPNKILGFLDIAGAWQPTLAFVMGGALMVTVPAFASIRRRNRPILETKFHLPTDGNVDLRLIGGAAVFGIGWGVAGFCPGPAITSLASGAGSIVVFCAAMIAGMWLSDRAAPR